MVFIASVVSQREHAEHDAGDSHNDRGAEQEWNREPLMVGELDATAPTTRKVAGVSGLTGKPVVIWSSSAAWANCTSARQAGRPPRR
jgi:hypothetical protein